MHAHKIDKQHGTNFKRIVTLHAWMVGYLRGGFEVEEDQRTSGGSREGRSPPETPMPSNKPQSNIQLEL